MRIFGLEISVKRLGEMRHQRNSSLASLLLPNTKFDYGQAVGDGLSSSVVIAPLMWVARNFPEAPVVVQRRQGEQYEAEPDHALTTLLRRPNPHYSGSMLWMATILSYMVDGNAYWAKIRNRQGAPIQLWYIPHWLIEPKVNPGSGATSSFIDYYEYRPGSERLRLDPQDVVHLRYGIDPHNTRKGLSLLAPLLREIFTDDEAANFTAGLLKNMGVPGVLIAPKQPNAVTPDQMKGAKEKLEAQFTGDERGKPLVLSGPTELTQFGFNPQQLDLKALRRIPEERVTAVFGIPAIVAGLGAGLDRSTFANYAEAREAAYESNIIPTQRIMAAELETQLLTDFEPRPEQYRITFDNSEVRILQEDENRAAERYALLYEKNLIRRSEGRRRMGFEVSAEDEVYFSQTQPKALALGKRLDAAWKALYDSWGPEVLEAEWKAADEELARWEERIARRVRGVFGKERDMVLAQLEELLRGASLVLATGDWEELLSYTYMQVGEAWGSRAASRFFSLEIPDGWRNRLVEWARAEAGKKVVGISGTSEEAIRAIITEGLAGGDSNEDIARRIKQLYTLWLGEEGMDGSRAITIARTETGAAANWGAYTGGLDTARAAGLIVEKGWLATMDSRTRDSHVALNGSWTEPEEPFANGLLYPHDPAGPAREVVRCRCALVWRTVE